MNDDLLSRISPVSDEAAAARVSERALAELAGQIVATRPPARRRRVAMAVLATAAAVAVATVIAVAGAPGARPPAPPARLTALTFSAAHGYIDVLIRDPYADPSVYRAEFAAHHLRISLLMVPGSPSVVGTLVMGGGDGITVLRQPGRGADPGGGACPAGVRIPLGFRGSAQLAFARPARPGEHYDTTGLVTAPGEAMHGLRFSDRPVAAVLAMLARRHVRVGAYRAVSVARSGAVITTGPSRVPGDWLVTGADPWAPGQVLLWVRRPGPPPRIPPGASCLPSAHGPVCATPAPRPS